MSSRVDHVEELVLEALSFRLHHPGGPWELDGLAGGRYAHWLSEARAIAQRVSAEQAPLPAELLPEQLELLEALPGSFVDADIARLAPRWRALLDAGRRSDGPAGVAIVGASLEGLEGFRILSIEAIASHSESWELALTLSSSLWEKEYEASPSGDEPILVGKRARLAFSARDDNGASYLSNLGRSSAAASSSSAPEVLEHLTVHFRPRLDPAARHLEIEVRGDRGQRCGVVLHLPRLRVSEGAV
jgi:hypothetical protein